MKQYIRQKCQNKISHSSKENAIIALKNSARRADLTAFRCKVCSQWHLGKSKKPMKKLARLNQLFAEIAEIEKSKKFG